MNMIGQTFQPGQDTPLRRRLNAQGASLSPMAQEALRVLSLRLPTVLAGRPTSPSDLLQPRVGGAFPGMPLAQRLAPQTAAVGSGVSPEMEGLMAIINQALGSRPASSGAGTGPTPRVIPITDTGEGEQAPTARTTDGGTLPLTPQMPRRPAMGGAAPSRWGADRDLPRLPEPFGGDFGF